jgi:hypothetical protein
MVLRDEPTNRLKDNRSVGQSVGQARPKYHHAHHHCQSAARTVMLVDQNKLGRGYRARVASHGDVARVLVDGPLDPAWRARLAIARADVIEVPRACAAAAGGTPCGTEDP